MGKDGKLQMAAGMFDLHLHSTASDGSMRPAELMKYCRSLGITAAALTDHDIIDGLFEAQAAAEQLGMGFVPGVELSADFDGELHILGYGIDRESRALDRFLKLQQRRRQKRDEMLIRSLNKHGIPLGIGDVQALSDDGIIGRNHFARALVKMGAASSVKEAFEKYIGSKGCCYTPRQKSSPEECVDAIRGSSGTAVWAHPAIMGLPVTGLKALGERLKSIGVEGMEAYYPAGGFELTGELEKLAKSLGMFCTYGSDFHSPDRGLAPGTAFDKYNIGRDTYSHIDKWMRG